MAIATVRERSGRFLPPRERRRVSTPDFLMNTAIDRCPAELRQDTNCYTLYALRVAYGLKALTEQGFTGKGQTVIDIVSFGSPTLQQDIDVFDRQFGLPPSLFRLLRLWGRRASIPTIAI